MKDLLHRSKAQLSATYVENDFDIYHLYPIMEREIFSVTPY